MISAYKHNLHFICLEDESILEMPINIRNHIIELGDKITYMGDERYNCIDTGNNNGYIEYSGYINSGKNKILLFIPNGWKKDEIIRQLSFLESNEEKQWYMAFLQIDTKVNKEGDLDYLTGPYGGLKQIYAKQINFKE
ncbi:hypothetical protein RBQ61_02865 [Sedimentibacter sp. MB35-C1]|uniref:hypothetical protein n=1 Tax=Sedimentibacter sp. MB35-C1 TaxID=3070995 RepID=UPI0027E165AE|nr:hypothetical protein [Sedimentibacter sp. MB35-C1]WMJ77887.1 hypothetical protein RBQ61_02865 [Sedimentibacter sp. MB35-C1]